MHYIHKSDNTDIMIKQICRDNNVNSLIHNLI